MYSYYEPEYYEDLEGDAEYQENINAEAELNQELEIQAGDWCKKYQDFVTQDTVDKCKRDKSFNERGCFYCECRKYKVSAR
ncbi:MAG: hypothetical protein ACPLRZ_07785 [Thermovenabulum sp.]|uniref:hypothetical protein n=1 Tax=Thermovenabulum sp. TaxID=3100335 RepID=UPI003C7DB873